MDTITQAHRKLPRPREDTVSSLFLTTRYRYCLRHKDGNHRSLIRWLYLSGGNISIDHVPDKVYAAAREQFTEEELIYLTLAIISINGWNRLAISFRTVPE